MHFVLELKLLNFFLNRGRFQIEGAPDGTKNIFLSFLLVINGVVKVFDSKNRSNVLITDLCIFYKTKVA